MFYSNFIVSCICLSSISFSFVFLTHHTPNTLFLKNSIVFKLGILVELDKSCAIYTVCNKPQIDISLTLHIKLSLLICLLQYLEALMQSRSNIYVVEKGSTLKILIGAIKYEFHNLSINAAAVGELVGGCLVLSILSTSVLYCVDYNGYVLNGSVVAGAFSRSYYFTRWQEYARIVFLLIIIVICFVYVSTQAFS